MHHLFFVWYCRSFMNTYSINFDSIAWLLWTCLQYSQVKVVKATHYSCTWDFVLFYREQLLAILSWTVQFVESNWQQRIANPNPMVGAEGTNFGKFSLSGTAKTQLWGAQISTILYSVSYQKWMFGKYVSVEQYEIPRHFVMNKWLTACLFNSKLWLPILIL